LSFCLRGILLSNAVCWAAFERVGLGSYKKAALSWLFRGSQLLWPWLLPVSILLVLRHYGITEVLGGDDSDRPRANVTQRMFGAHKVFDKKTGGYFNGQVVVLFLITPKVSLPVGFRCYQPDPALKEWKQPEEELKQPGVKKSERPPRPEPQAAYPSQQQLLLVLLEECTCYPPGLVVKVILAEALSGSGGFMNRAAAVCGTQTISQLAQSQTVRVRPRDLAVAQYFATYPGVEMTLRIRGFKEVKVVLGSARWYVKAHQQQRFVVALK
jgi:hypothetical protein